MRAKSQPRSCEKRTRKRNDLNPVARDIRERLSQQDPSLVHERVSTLAKIARRSEREIYRWKAAAHKPIPRRGRPPASMDERVSALRTTARLWRRTNRKGGEPQLWAMVKDGKHLVSRRLLREMLGRLKARRKARLAARKGKGVHIRVHAKNALVAQDATHIGRIVVEQRSGSGTASHAVHQLDQNAAQEALGNGINPLSTPRPEGKETEPEPSRRADRSCRAQCVVCRPRRARAIQAEVVRDAATTRLLLTVVALPTCGHDVIDMMERLRCQGELPLVYLSDNGPAYRCAALARYFEAHQVVHLFSLPHTPQHNGGVERANRELKEDAELEGEMTLEQVRSSIEASRVRLNNRPRPSREGLTADQLDSILPNATTVVSREAFYNVAQRAVADAVAGALGYRARRTATRRAILATMESFNLITVTRGDAQLPCHQD